MFRLLAISVETRCGLPNYVTGDKALDALLEELGTKVANKAITSGLRAGLGHVTKAIRAEIPQPSVKKAIGSKLKRLRDGSVIAKVGAGVGPRTRKELGPRGNRPGVGISARNIHWYILGTRGRNHGLKWNKTLQKDQKTGNAFRYTGRMPKNAAVKKGWGKSKDTCLKAIQTKVAAVLQKEMQKPLAKELKGV